MAVFSTILAGVIVYILGQIALKFVVEPLHAQRETIGKITDFLIQHATRIAFPGFSQDNRMIIPGVTSDLEWKAQLIETKERARELASELMVRTQAIPLYTTFQRLGWVRTREDIRISHKSLIGISFNLLKVDKGAGPVNMISALHLRQALRIETAFEAEDLNSQAVSVETNDQ